VNISVENALKMCSAQKGNRKTEWDN